MEFSLLFPTPVATSGEPHRIGLRRVAFLLYGKPGARLSGKEDVIEVRAPGSDTEGRALGLADGMALVMRRFASQGSGGMRLHGWQQRPRRVGSHQRRLHLHRRRRGPVAHLPGFGVTGWRCKRVSSPGPGTPRNVAILPPDRWAHPAPSPICSRKGYSQSFRRPGGRFATAIANTSGWGTTPNCWRTPPSAAAPSIRRADPVLAGTAVRTHRPKRRAAVFHRHALDVPRRSLRPALQAVDFCSVRRCGHGQLLHWLASIQLWPARLRRFRMLCRSIVALKAQVARPGGDIPRQSRVPFPCGVGTTPPS